MKTKAVRWQKNGKAQDKNYEKKTNKTIPGINETRSEKTKLKNLYTNLSNEKRPKVIKLEMKRGRFLQISMKYRKVLGSTLKMYFPNCKI